MKDGEDQQPTSIEDFRQVMEDAARDIEQKFRDLQDQQDDDTVDLGEFTPPLL